MSRASRTSCLADALGAALDHQDRLLGAGDDQVHLQLLERLLVGVDDEVAVELSDPHRADRRRHGDLGDRDRRRGAVHRQDVVGVDVVHRHRLADDLGLVVPTLGEQGADRPVDHPRRQGGLLTGAGLTAKERSRDLPGRVMALLDIHRQRQKVDVAQIADGRRAQDHRVPGARDHRPARLAGQLARLEGDFLIADLRRDAAYVKHAHTSLSTTRLVAATRSELSFSYRRDVTDLAAAGFCAAVDLDSFGGRLYRAGWPLSASRIRSASGISSGLGDSCTQLTTPSASTSTSERLEVP